MNPILRDLENKQWIWTAAKIRQSDKRHSQLETGFDTLDQVLSGGFPHAGMIHINSKLGCGELRLMLEVLKHQKQPTDDKLWVFIDPPFQLNAEFLLNEGVSLDHLVLLHPNSTEEALWSAEQCAKSGACNSVFLWPKNLSHKHIRKLELAALHGESYCFWFDQSEQSISNLPLSLSLSLKRENESLQVKINKQKVGWAQPSVKVRLPFKSLTRASFRAKAIPTNNVTNIHSTS